MLSSGRAARLRECLVSGDDTQRSSAYPTAANQTGDTHGRPSASAVPSVMYRFESRISRPAAARSLRSSVIRFSRANRS